MPTSNESIFLPGVSLTLHAERRPHFGRTYGRWSVKMVGPSSLESSATVTFRRQVETKIYESGNALLQEVSQEILRVVNPEDRDVRNVLEALNSILGDHRFSNEKAWLTHWCLKDGRVHLENRFPDAPLVQRLYYRTPRRFSAVLSLIGLMGLTILISLLVYGATKL